jgi:hypothetical protein
MRELRRAWAMMTCVRTCGPCPVNRYAAALEFVEATLPQPFMIGQRALGQATRRRWRSCSCGRVQGDTGSSTSTGRGSRGGVSRGSGRARAVARSLTPAARRTSFT